MSETTTEKIFRERVMVRTSDLQYVERGNDFIRFRAEDGNLYDVVVVPTKIIKPKLKKPLQLKK